MRKNILFSCLIFLIVNKTATCQTTPLIMVGKAFKDKKCTSGSVTSSFSDCVGYIISIDCAKPFDYTGQQNKLKTEVATKYGVTSTNTSITTSSTKSTVVVLKYNKPISAWNCTVARFAVGFGNSFAEAQADAVENKELDHKSSSWTFVEELNCNLLSAEDEIVAVNATKIHPNPTTNILNIHKQSNYQIVDSFGIELLRGEDDKIDVSGLPSGIYFIKIESTTLKFIKE